MADNDIGSLVVMDHGKLIGMLTFREVLAALAKGGGTLGRTRVSEIFDRDPVTATPKLDVMELRVQMLERHARYVPVMDEANAARRRVVSRRGQGGLRRGVLREPDAQELHRGFADGRSLGFHHEHRRALAQSAWCPRLSTRPRCAARHFRRQRQVHSRRTPGSRAADTSPRVWIIAAFR
jgi:hypothetical protein